MWTKVLNLYASIWWNRKLRTDVEVTAVEREQERADYYKQQFPNDTVIVWDAHDYLLKHYKEFDFIRASPPCPTHSRLVFSNETRMYPIWRMKYPDMWLYQEIILLKTWALPETKRVIENVIPYYEPLIKWYTILERHFFWSNFFIPNFVISSDRKHHDIKIDSTTYWFDLSWTNIKNKRKCLRDLVNPELALHIFEASKRETGIQPMF